MKLKGLIEEDFVNYKLPSMFLITPYCDFKCCKENGNDICQNMSITKEPVIDIDEDELIKRYLDNPISKSIVFGGLEPLYNEECFNEIVSFIRKLRTEHNCKDPIIIYTGYYPSEVIDSMISLSKFSNIIVKFGRFIPGHKEHFDSILGVNLASDNQWAVQL